MKMRVSHFDQHAVVIVVIGISANKPAEDWQSFSAEVSINAKLDTHIIPITKNRGYVLTNFQLKKSLLLLYYK